MVSLLIHNVQPESFTCLRDGTVFAYMIRPSTIVVHDVVHKTSVSFLQSCQAFTLYSSSKTLYTLFVVHDEALWKIAVDVKDGVVVEKTRLIKTPVLRHDTSMRMDIYKKSFVRVSVGTSFRAHLFNIHDGTLARVDIWVPKPTETQAHYKPNARFSYYVVNEWNWRHMHNLTMNMQIYITDELAWQYTPRGAFLKAITIHTL